MCPDWTPAELLIAAVKQSRIDKEISDRQEAAEIATLPAWRLYKSAESQTLAI